MQIINTLEFLSTIDRPGHRMKVDGEFFFYFFQQVETILAIAVHFIDKNDHRRIPHAAYFHQPSCLFLYPIHTIHYENNAVYSSKSPVSILSKILVTGSIE